ncbi:MAG: hypothetical protein R2874_05525 [Desulfobacterales bacterium]
MIKDILNDDRIQHPDAAKKEGIASMMGIPIKYRSLGDWRHSYL